MATTSKAILVFCFCALLGCLLFFEAATARVIGYVPISQGKLPKCKGPQCLPPPANHYSRGCEKEEKCRPGVPAAPASNKEDEPNGA